MIFEEFIRRVLGSADQLFSGLLENFALALLIILIGFVFGKLLGRIVRRVLHELGLDARLERSGFSMPFEATIGVLLSYCLYAVAVILALNQLGLTRFTLYIVISVSLFLVLLSTLFGLRDIIPNLFAGIYLYRKKLFRRGQKVVIGDVHGKVCSVSILETELVTPSGDVVFVPNALLLRSAVVVEKK